MFTITVDPDISLHLIQEEHHHIIFKLLEDNRDHLREHMGEFDKTRDDIRQRCVNDKQSFAQNGTLSTLIMYQGQAVGKISLRNHTGGIVSGAEIGYWLAEGFVGKGIITRATKTMTDYAFAHLDVNRVYLGITPQNPRSYAIPERLGFTLEGTIRQNEQLNGEWIDHRIYTMLKQDWELPQNLPILRYQINDKLELRPIEKQHATELFTLCIDNQSHIGEWLPWVYDTKTVDDTMGFIEESLKQYGNNDGWQVGIWHDNQLVGMIGYLYWNFQNYDTEIGYWLAESATGHGIMTRCTRELVRYAIDTLKLNRVIIRCADGNIKSANVAIRLGFTHEGTHRQSLKLQDQFHDGRIYGLLAEEWQNQ